MNLLSHNSEPLVGTTEPENRIDDDDATAVGMDKLDALHPLRQQIEYYFGAQNLPRDTFLQQVLSRNHGLAPVRIIANFPKVQALYHQIQHNRDDEETALESIEVILYRALQDSDVVTVTDDGYYLRPYWGSFLPNSGYPPPHIVIASSSCDGRALNVGGTTTNIMDNGVGPPTVATISPASLATTAPSTEHDSQTLEEPMPYHYTESMAPSPHHSYFAPTYPPSPIYAHVQNTLYSNWSTGSTLTHPAANHLYYPPTGYYSTGPTTLYPASRYDDRYPPASLHSSMQLDQVSHNHPLAYAPADTESKASTTLPFPNESITSQVPWPPPRGAHSTVASAHGSVPVTQHGMVALDMHFMPPPPYYVYAPTTETAGPSLDYPIGPSTSSAAMNHRRVSVPNQSTNRVQQSTVPPLPATRLNKRHKQQRGKHAPHSSDQDSVQRDGNKQHGKASPLLHILPQKSRDMGGSGLPRVAHVDARGAKAADHGFISTAALGTAPTADEPPFFNNKISSATGSSASATAKAKSTQLLPASKKKHGRRAKNKFLRDKVSIASLEHFPKLSKKDTAGSDVSLAAATATATATKVKSPTKRYSEVLLKTTAPAKSLRATPEMAKAVETTPLANLQGLDKSKTSAVNIAPRTGSRNTTESEQNGASTT
jgi:La domain